MFTLTLNMTRKTLKNKGMQLTLVLPIVGLDIGAISSSNSIVLWFGA
jgi:hypothetical protein